MFDIKNTENLNFIVNTVDNTAYLSVSEYARFIGKAESGVRNKLADNTSSIKVSIKGITYRLMPVELCLQLLIEDKPEKINIFADSVFKTTGQPLKFPNFSNIKNRTKTKSGFIPLGFIYLFESNLGILKVGFTKNIKTRLNQLQRWDGELTIVDVIQGSIQEEKELHKLLHATGNYFGDEWYPIDRKTEIVTILGDICER
jgi:hypothetical protein